MPLCKKLDCGVKSEPPYFVATNLDGFMVCNIDDIFILRKNMEDHECHVCLVFEKLEEVKFYAILKKFEFYQTKVEFLHYIILRNDICMDPYMFQTFVNWATQLLFMNFNVVLDSLTSIDILLHIIPQ